MLTGIIILNYNSNEDLYLCVESIQKNISAKYKLYIVDNNSSQDNKDGLKKRYEKNQFVELIFLNENVGYSGGNNVGVRRAVRDKVDYVLIMNPDIIVKNDIIKEFAGAISDEYPCVGPKIIDADGGDGQRIRRNYNFKYALFSKKPFYYLRDLFDADSRYKYNTDRCFGFVGSLSGCCFFITAKVFWDVDFFDDNVFLYCEEYILGCKLERLGYKCKYVPSAVIYHKEGTSTRKISNSFVDYHMYASEYYLVSRYCGCNRIEKFVISVLRLGNYWLKNVIKYKDWERMKGLYKTFRRIDHKRYKILF